MRRGKRPGYGKFASNRTLGGSRLKIIGIITSKESEPRGPGIDFTPEGWLLQSHNPWNNGMVEKWNIGNHKRMIV